MATTVTVDGAQSATKLYDGAPKGAVGRDSYQAPSAEDGWTRTLNWCGAHPKG